jgi:hypothetical protein
LPRITGGPCNVTASHAARRRRFRIALAFIQAGPTGWISGLVGSLMSSVQITACSARRVVRQERKLALLSTPKRCGPVPGVS